MNYYILADFLEFLIFMYLINEVSKNKKLIHELTKIIKKLAEADLNRTKT